MSVLRPQHAARCKLEFTLGARGRAEAEPSSAARVKPAANSIVAEEATAPHQGLARAGAPEGAGGRLGK